MTLERPSSRGITDESGEIIFIVKKYFHEFKEAYGEYKQQLLYGEGKETTILQRCFDRSIREYSLTTVKADNMPSDKDQGHGKDSISLQPLTESIHEER